MYVCHPFKFKHNCTCCVNVAYILYAISVCVCVVFCVTKFILKSFNKRDGNDRDLNMFVYITINTILCYKTDLNKSETVLKSIFYTYTLFLMYNPSRGQAINKMLFHI